jgi:hypothetical protein
MSRSLTADIAPLIKLLQAGVPPARAAAELSRVLAIWTAELKDDEAQLQDHLASFLADLASTLTTMDLSNESVDPGLEDGTAIQRVVSVRHGAQRARLGWSPEEIRREFAILREELGAAVKRRALQVMRGPADGRTAEVERAISLLDHFVTISEGISLASFAEASANINQPAGDMR